MSVLLEITKRDGRVVSFDKEKIKLAVQKSFIAVDGELTEYAKIKSENIADFVESKALEKNLTVEDIQDLVENGLMSTKRKDVARAYILYRNERTKEREKRSSIISIYKNRIYAKKVENSNANVDERSFSGREKEAASDIAKAIATDFGGMSEPVARAHKEMRVYGHDLEKFLEGEHNCLQIDFQEIFNNGFVARNGDVRPPKSLSTGMQLIAVTMQCQSQVQFGGCGTIHIDYDLAPLVKFSFRKHYLMNIIKDSEDFIDLNIWNLSMEDLDDWVDNNINNYLNQYNLTKEDIYIDNKENLNPKYYQQALFDLYNEGRQAAQGLYHNLGTLESRQGSQVPFTSINLGRDTSTEGRLVSQWIFEASLDGVGKLHKTAIFPISIFQYKQGCNANPEDPNYDLKQLALKSLSKRIYPNWVNCDWSQAHEDPNNPDTFMNTMGCRTMIGYDRNGMGYIRKGRGNNAPATMILPKLGIDHGICLGKRTEPDLDGFWKDLDENYLKITEMNLLERYEIMKKQSPKSAPFMYKNNTIVHARDCKENVEEALKHNSLAFGIIGMAEMCTALFGKNHAENPKVHEFALSVMKHIYDYVQDFSERTGLNGAVYYTPAEGLCSTALKALRKQYGIIENVTSHEYLTNSIHVPVWMKVSIFDKLKLEAPFLKYATGGSILYIELDSTFIQNTKAIESIIDYAFKELDVPYLAFNFPIDTCLDCGYQSEFNECCPVCGSKNIEQLRRVTGYLSTDYHNFNDGKIAEVEERIKHSAYTDFTLESELINNKIIEDLTLVKELCDDTIDKLRKEDN